jgi:hypothetical protein
MNWYQYQEQTADFFRNLGAKVETNKKVKGIRGSHNIDVYIEFSLWGQKIIWICECKLWKTSIPKDKVLTLYQIVQDIGADKGMLFSESGFQSGAINSTKNTNISLLNVEELKNVVSEELIESLIIRSIKKFNDLKARITELWINEDGYPETFPNISRDNMALLDGTMMFMTLHLQKALNNKFPIKFLSFKHKSKLSNSYEELVRNIDSEIKDIEMEVLAAEKKARRNIQKIEKLKAQLIVKINSLLTTGEKFILDSEKNIELAKEVVEIMKSISDLATNLEAISRANVTQQIQKIMRYLIDNTYLLLTKSETSLQIWNESKSKLFVIIEEFEQKKTY